MLGFQQFCTPEISKNINVENSECHGSCDGSSDLEEVFRKLSDLVVRFSYSKEPPLSIASPSGERTLAHPQ